jgi:hypothetical protein
MGNTVVAESGSLIKSSQAVGQLGVGLFGDKLNLHNGALEFYQTDVSLPGNSSLPVHISRRTQIGGRGTEGNGLFKNWDLALPKISGMFSTKYGGKAFCQTLLLSVSLCSFGR